MRLAKEIKIGELPPKWYGHAFYRFRYGRSVCYPIPLNYIVGFFRALFWRDQ